MNENLKLVKILPNESSSLEKIEEERFKNLKYVHSNAQMPSQMAWEVCKLEQAGIVLLKTAMKKLQLSTRAYNRILKVARTAADLANKKDILIEHLAEAIPYRSLDRDSWGGWWYFEVANCILQFWKYLKLKNYVKQNKLIIPEESLINKIYSLSYTF